MFIWNAFRDFQSIVLLYIYRKRGLYRFLDDNQQIQRDNHVGELDPLASAQNSHQHRKP